MQERWYQWFGDGRRGQTTAVRRMEVPGLREFVPHTFQMDEATFQRAVKLVLETELGETLTAAKPFQGRPDLRLPGHLWFELKDDSIKETCRWKSKRGQTRLDQQVATYASKYPTEAPNVPCQAPPAWDHPRATIMGPPRSGVARPAPRSWDHPPRHDHGTTPAGVRSPPRSAVRPSPAFHQARRG